MSNSSHTASVTRAREAERKYVPKRETPGEIDMSDLGTLSDERVDELVAIYFDTPGLDLLQARITLRRRAGGSDAGWHLKTPGTSQAAPTSPPGEVRGEPRLPLDGTTRVPARIRAEVSHLINDAPLLPLVRMRTLRRTRELRAADGTPRAEVCIDSVETSVLRGSAQADDRWQELEVELAEQEPLETLNELEPALLTAGYARSTLPSKLARAVREIAPMPAASLDTSAATAVATLFGAHYGVFQSLESAVLADEPDAVHQARVALRRMRSLLQAFRVVFPRDVARLLRDELRWAGEVLGEARDSEVIMAALDELFDRAVDDATKSESEALQAARSTVDGNLAARHDRAMQHIRNGVASPRWDQLHRLVSELVAEVPSSAKGRRPAHGVLPTLAVATETLVETRRDAAQRYPDDLDAWLA